MKPYVTKSRPESGTYNNFSGPCGCDEGPGTHYHIYPLTAPIEIPVDILAAIREWRSAGRALSERESTGDLPTPSEWERHAETAEYLLGQVSECVEEHAAHGEAVAAASSNGDGEKAGRRYNDHSNDIGDWCPWSGKPVQGVDDGACPALCRHSEVEGDDEDDGPYLTCSRCGGEVVEGEAEAHYRWCGRSEQDGKASQ